MENYVKNLKISGSDLNKIEYFAHKKYYESLLIETIDAHFLFNIDGEKYEVKISYGFPSYFKKLIPDTEFVSSIQDITDSNQEKKISDTLHRRVNEIFSNYKTEQFNKLKKEKVRPGEFEW